MEKEKVVEVERLVEVNKVPNFKERLASLLSVKSLVTVILTLVFAYLSITKIISGEQFIILFTTIIAFYFGVQAVKE